MGPAVVLSLSGVGLLEEGAALPCGLAWLPAASRNTMVVTDFMIFLQGTREMTARRN